MQKPQTSFILLLSLFLTSIADAGITIKNETSEPVSYELAYPPKGYKGILAPFSQKEEDMPGGLTGTNYKAKFVTHGKGLCAGKIYHYNTLIIKSDTVPVTDDSYIICGVYK